MNGPALETERPILRPLATDPLEPWVALHADPATMFHLGEMQWREIARGLKSDFAGRGVAREAAIACMDGIRRPI